MGYQNLIINLKSRPFTSESNDDINANEIYELKIKQKEIEDAIIPIEEEFKILDSYF